MSHTHTHTHRGAYSHLGIFLGYVYAPQSVIMWNGMGEILVNLQIIHRCLVFE